MKTNVLALLILLRCDLVLKKSTQDIDSDINYYLHCLKVNYKEFENELHFDGTQGVLTFDIAFVNWGKDTLDFKIKYSEDDDDRKSKFILVDINRDTVRGYADPVFSSFSIFPKKQWTCLMYVDNFDADKNFKSHLKQFKNIRFYKKMLALKGEIYYVENNKLIKVHKTIADIDEKYINNK